MKEKQFSKCDICGAETVSTLCFIKNERGLLSPSFLCRKCRLKKTNFCVFCGKYIDKTLITQEKISTKFGTIQTECICFSCYEAYKENRCSVCNVLIEPGAEIEYENRIYCPKCFEKEFRRCYVCFRLVHKSEIIVINRTEVCLNCFKNQVITCSVCGQYVLKEDTVKIQNNLICEECVRKRFRLCEFCNQYKPKYKISQISLQFGDSILDFDICEDCINNPPKCEICQKPTPFHSAYHSKLNNSRFCFECICNPFNEDLIKKHFISTEDYQRLQIENFKNCNQNFKEVF